MKIKIKIKKLQPNVKLPEYQTGGSSGMDIVSQYSGIVFPHTTVSVPTGLCVEVPDGYELQIRSRSSLAKKGLIVANQPGTVDSDYRGEVKILLHSLSDSKLGVCEGDRIAQMVLCPVIKVEFEEVEDLSDTDRGDGGFGSTGI